MDLVHDLFLGQLISFLRSVPRGEKVERTLLVYGVAGVRRNAVGNEKEKKRMITRKWMNATVM
jgi:hypothetical protein